MSGQPLIPIQNAIFCEHVVAGPYNKNTLINVYSGDIIVDALPAVLTVGLYIEIGPGLPQGAQLKVELRLDGDAFANMEVALQGDAAGAANIVIPLMQLGIDRDLTFYALITAEGYAETLALKKRVFMGKFPVTSPTASAQPPSQSPPDAPGS